MKPKYKTLLLSFAILASMNCPVVAGEDEIEELPPEVDLPAVVVVGYPEPPELVFVPTFPDPAPRESATTAVQSAPPRSTRPDEGCTQTQHPVVIKTGNKVRSDIDWTTEFSVPLQIKRSYNAAANSYHVKNIFGKGWYSNLDARLFTYGSFSVFYRLTGDGSVYSFSRIGLTWVWVDDTPGSNAKIVGGANGTYLLQYNNRTAEVYNRAGRITSVRNEFGVGHDYYYVDGKISKVVHTNGAQFSLDWLNGKVAGIADPSGAIYTYEYDANGMLAKVISNGAEPRTSISYSYQSSAPFNLLSVSYDGILYAESDYYPDGKAFHSGLAGGVERDTFLYGSAPGGITYTQIIGSAGATEKYTYSPASTMNRLISVERNGTTGCPASGNKYEYDSSGAMVATEDFNGVRTCYQLDPVRQEEILRVEGLPSGFACSSVVAENSPLPLGARKVSRKIHPDWALVTMKASPGSIDTWIYNGMPDPTKGGAIANCVETNPAFPQNSSLSQPEKPLAVLCKEVAEATTDVTGSLGFGASFDSSIAKRISSYTYDQFGRMKTRTDPRGKATSYEHYASSAFNGSTGGYAGQLKSVTNAKLQTTTFQYDKSGRLVSSQDPNQVRNVYQYWGSGDLKSSSVGYVSPTLFSYFRWGLLKRMTRPDGSYLDYDYDPARRLIGVKDSLGNYITYELGTDPISQQNTQIAKTVAADGRITRVERSRFDARGRLRNVNGAASTVVSTNATSTLAVAKQPSNATGTNVTFSAYVSGLFQPAGFVKFTATATAPGYAPIEMGQCAISAGYCSLDFVFTAAEEWSVVATYLGDSNNAPSSSPAIVVPIMRTITKPPPPASSR